MNDYIYYYALAGLAYAIVMEYEYRTSSEFDNTDYWWFGELVALILTRVYNILFWPKLIVDDMIDSYFEHRAPDDEDSL